MGTKGGRSARWSPWPGTMGGLPARWSPWPGTKGGPRLVGPRGWGRRVITIVVDRVDGEGEGHGASWRDPFGGSVGIEPVGPPTGVLDQVVVSAQVRQVARAGVAIRPRDRMVHVGLPPQAGRERRPIAAPHPALPVTGGDELTLRLGDRVAGGRRLEERAGAGIEQGPAHLGVEAADDRRHHVRRDETDPWDGRPRDPRGVAPFARADLRGDVREPLLRQHVHLVRARSGDDPDGLRRRPLVLDVVGEQLADLGIGHVARSGGRPSEAGAARPHGSEGQSRRRRGDHRDAQPDLCRHLDAAECEVGQTERPSGADRHRRVRLEVGLGSRVDGRLESRSHLARQGRRQITGADRPRLRADVESGGAIGIRARLHELGLEAVDQPTTGLGDLMRLHPGDADGAGLPTSLAEQVLDHGLRRLRVRVPRVLAHLLQGSAAHATAREEGGQIGQVGGGAGGQIASPSGLRRSHADRQRHRIGCHVGHLPLGQSTIAIETVGAALLAPSVDLGNEGQLQRVDGATGRLRGPQAALELRIITGRGGGHRRVTRMLHEAEYVAQHPFDLVVGRWAPGEPVRARLRPPIRVPRGVPLRLDDVHVIPLRPH